MKSVKKLFVPTVYLVAVLSVLGCVFLTIYSINKYLTESERFDYSINGIIDGKVNLFKVKKRKLKLILLSNLIGEKM